MVSEENTTVHVMLLIDLLRVQSRWEEKFKIPRAVDVLLLSCFLLPSNRF